MFNYNKLKVNEISYNSNPKLLESYVNRYNNLANNNIANSKKEDYNYLDTISCDQTNERDISINYIED